MSASCLQKIRKNYWLIENIQTNGWKIQTEQTFFYGIFFPTRLSYVEKDKKIK